LIAWMIDLRVPSYAPTARARSTPRPPRRQRGHWGFDRLIDRQEGRESPQRSQSGGVSGRTRRQQRAQTGPSVGRSSGSWHAAQAGARMTLRIESAA
jgi:hypothetical protein